MSEAALQQIQTGLAGVRAALLQGELEAMHGHLVRTLDALAAVTRAGLVARQDQPGRRPRGLAGRLRAGRPPAAAIRLAARHRRSALRQHGDLRRARQGYSVDLFGLRRDPVAACIEGGAWLYGKPASWQRVLASSQTPQAYATALLREVSTRAVREGWQTQSTVQLMLRAGHAVAAVPG
jgi:hypothetical protein